MKLDNTNTHTLQIRNLQPGWNDRCEVFPHAIFSLICDFVENEFGEGAINGEFNSYVEWCKNQMEADDFSRSRCFPENQYEAALKIKEVYDWYTQTCWDEVDTDDSNLREIMKKMMLKCIDIYPSLWT